MRWRASWANRLARWRDGTFCVAVHPKSALGVRCTIAAHLCSNCLSLLRRARPAQKGLSERTIHAVLRGIYDVKLLITDRVRKLRLPCEIPAHRDADSSVILHVEGASTFHLNASARARWLKGSGDS
jgi:hypothetical protein